jgi:hypothetical protein
MHTKSKDRLWTACLGAFSVVHAFEFICRKIRCPPKLVGARHLCRFTVRNDKTIEMTHPLTFRVLKWRERRAPYPWAKAVLKQPHSRRFARFNEASWSRSVWIAAGSPPLFVV